MYQFLKKNSNITIKINRCWYWVSDGISEYTYSEYFSYGVDRWYIQYLILIVFRMIFGRVIGWLHAPYINLYIHTDYWNISLFVTSIMHYTASWVLFWPRKFIISCFYQLIGFLANCRHLTAHLEYLRSDYYMLSVIDRLQDQRLAPFNLFTVCHKKIVSFNLELPYKYINWRDTRELSENCESFLIIVWKLRSLLVYGRILRCRLFE